MRLNLTREFFLPKTFIRKIEGKGGLEIYVTNESDRPAAKAFAGKKAKPIWNYYFGNVERMEKTIADTLASYEAEDARKAARKAEKAAFDATTAFAVGDIITNSWGYEQTNVDAFVVVKVSAKRVTLREIGVETVPGSGISHGMADHVKPVVTKGGKESVHGVSIHGVNFKYGSGSKWDGKRSLYRSWYA